MAVPLIAVGYNVLTPIVLRYLAKEGLKTMTKTTAKQALKSAKYQGKKINPKSIDKFLESKTFTKQADKFKQTKQADKAAGKRITEKLGTKKPKKQEEIGYEGLPKSTGDKLRKINEAERKAKQQRGSVTARKELDKKKTSSTRTSRLKKAAGITAGTVAVTAAVDKISDSSSKAKASAMEKKKKAEAAKRKREEDKRKAKKKTETKKDSAPSRIIDNTADYSRASSDYRSRGTSPKRNKTVARPSSFRDIDAKEKKKKDTGGVKTRFGGRVTTRSGSLRTRGN